MISNGIRFDCQHRGDRGPLVVVPHIGGAPLTELIDEYEIAAGMQPAGDAYGGLIPEFFRFGPMQDHFLGLSTRLRGQVHAACGTGKTIIAAASAKRLVLKDRGYGSSGADIGRKCSAWAASGGVRSGWWRRGRRTSEAPDFS